MKILKIISLIFVAFYFFTSCKQENEILITVNQYVNHPNLEKTYKGVTETVNEWAIKNGKKVIFDYQIANGDVSLATQIAQQQYLKKPKLMLALATPSAQACQKVTNNTPIVFGAITDPIKAGLVKSYENPGGNITGTSDQWPYDKQFEFIRTIIPEAKKIGVLLNPSESNTEASMIMVRNVAKKYNFQLIESPVSSTAEIYPAANSLVGKCDVFFAPADNTVLSGLDAFVKVSKTNNIPLFVGDEGSVEKGGVATYGIDYYELGKETGKIIVEILEGKTPATIPVVVGSSGKLIVNKKSIDYFNIKLPENYLKEAEIK